MPTFHSHKAIVGPSGFGATFAAVFVLIYRLREFPLSAVANRFELRSQLKEPLLLYQKFCPCSTDPHFLLKGSQESVDQM